MLRLVALLHLIDFSYLTCALNVTGHDFLDHSLYPARRADTDYSAEVKDAKALFGILQNDHKDGRKLEIKELDVSRVIHSRTSNTFPFICTCSCIAERIFMTAARCIRNLKVKYTSVFHLEKYLLHAEAFVLPTKSSKQYYSDIGLVIVASGQMNGDWRINDLDIPVKRITTYFQWEADLTKRLNSRYGRDNYLYAISGFACDQEMLKSDFAKIIYTPFVLDNLKLSATICSELFSRGKVKEYQVPCLSICSVEAINDPEKRKKDCQSYLGAEGGLVFVYGQKDGKRWRHNLGVVTWGSKTDEGFSTPVGMALLGTKKFEKSLECAQKIVMSNSKPSKGYQELCTKQNVYF